MCIDFKRTKEMLQESDMKLFYEQVYGFIEYPTLFLPELASIFENEMEGIKELKQLVGLLEMDNYALDYAQAHGVHPITGVEYSPDFAKTYANFRVRNLKMIARLNAIIHVLESKPEESKFKSRYEDPNDSLFVG